MAKRFFLFFVTIGLICSLAGLSACKSPSSPSGGNPQEETYTVKFVKDDGSLVGEEFKDKKAGAEITVPEEPESVNNPGWEFSGWYLNGDNTKPPVSGKYTVKAEDAVDNVITIKAVYVDSSTAVPPDSISLEPVSATLEVGGKYNLANVKVTYSPGGTNTQRDITWSIKTGSESATLNGTMVTAVKEGEVVLTATTANGKTAEFTLTVNDSLQSISVTAAPATVQVGKTSSLTVKAVYSSGEKELTATDVEFTVNPADAGTVTGGVFTAAKAGEAEITASYGEKTAKVTVTVTEEPVPDPVYTVKFVKDDGSTVVEAFTEQTAGAEITVPGKTPDSTKGYDVFEGWYLNGDSTKTPVSGKYTVKAEDAQEGVITIKAVYKQTVHVEKIVSETQPDGATWFWGGSVKVFAFVTGGYYEEGLWVPVTNHVTAGEGDDPTNYDAKVELYPDWEKFYLVRANSETTEPNLSMVLDGEGRVYNKTHDIINGEAGTIAETEVYDYVPAGYIRICTSDIAGKGFTYSTEKKLVVYVFDSTASAEDQVVGWFDTTRYDYSNFYFSLSDAQAEATEQGKTVTHFIFVQLKTSDATSDWDNKESQTENMEIATDKSVYYPKNWSSNGY